MANRTSPALRQYGAALRTLLLLTVILGLAYPLAMTGFAQVAFGNNANGSLVQRGGKTVGSHLIGQGFTRPVLKNGQPTKDAKGNPVVRGGPQVLPEPALGGRAGIRPAVQRCLQPRPREQGPDRLDQGTPGHCRQA